MLMTDQAPDGTLRPGRRAQRFINGAVLAYLAQVLKKIGDFEPATLQIPGVFVVDGPDSACSEDLAS